jgi:hypothetical protein
MARSKKKLRKQPLVTQSLTLTRQDVETLQYLSQDATDFIGRATGRSAIVRALVRYADQQHETWAREHLFPFIEEELSKGVMWGKQQ